MQIALALRSIPLENITMVQYPSTTGGTGIYLNKVQPIQSTAKALFEAIRNDQPIGLDENAIGANGGSTLDPNAPVATPTPEPTASGEPVDPAKPATVIEGLKGQSAAQYTCSVAN